MACTNCVNGCDCLVIAGRNVTVTGDGSPGNPYVISSTGGGGGGLVYDGANGSTAPPIVLGNFVICSPAGGGVPGSASQFGGDWPCADSFGTKVYQTTGGLRSVPPQFAVNAGAGAQVLVFPTNVPLGNSNTCVFMGPATPVLVMNNPSSCRPMSTYSGFNGNYNYTTQLGFGFGFWQKFASFNGGPFGRVANDSTSAVPPVQIEKHMGAVVDTRNVGPGGSLTFALQFRAGVSNPNTCIVILVTNIQFSMGVTT